MFTFGHVQRNVVQFDAFFRRHNPDSTWVWCIRKVVKFYFSTRPDIAVSSAADYNLTTINLGKSRP